MKINERTRKKFFERIKKNLDGCWLWTGYTNSCGYGQMGIFKKKYQAHRISWFIHKGAVSEGKQLNHTCDVSLCCNPEHLYEGTVSENMQDCLKRSKSNKNFKIDVETALEIASYKDKYNGVAISKILDIPKSLVQCVLRGETWWQITGIKRHIRGSIRTNKRNEPEVSR